MKGIFLVLVCALGTQICFAHNNGNCQEVNVLIFGEPQSSSVENVAARGAKSIPTKNVVFTIPSIQISNAANLTFPHIPAGAIIQPTLTWDSGAVNVDVPQYDNGTVPTSRIQITEIQDHKYPGKITSSVENLPTHVSLQVTEA